MEIITYFLEENQLQFSVDLSSKSREPIRKSHRIHPAADGHVCYKKQGEKKNKDQKSIRYELIGNHILLD